MVYRLDALAKLARELGLASERVNADRLDVIIHDGCRLAFCNLPGEGDTLVGFDGTPWHSHGIVSFLAGSPQYVECDELDILIGLGSGDLLVVSQFIDGDLKDRWIEHRAEPFDLKYVQPNEELRVFRLPVRAGDTRSASVQ